MCTPSGCRLLHVSEFLDLLCDVGLQILLHKITRSRRVTMNANVSVFVPNVLVSESSSSTHFYCVHFAFVGC